MVEESKSLRNLIRWSPCKIAYSDKDNIVALKRIKFESVSGLWLSFIISSSLSNIIAKLLKYESHLKPGFVYFARSGLCQQTII